MMRVNATAMIAMSLLIGASHAGAVEVIHYDEYSSQFNEAAGQIQGGDARDPTWIRPR